MVESPDGGYVCTYTAFDGKNGALCVATSADLRHVGQARPGVRRLAVRASGRRRAASIVTEVVDGRLVAARRDGRYWMYWGEGTCFAATSDRPHPLDSRSSTTPPATATSRSIRPSGGWGLERVAGQRVLRPLLFPRRGRFDSLLVEPGPPAVVTDDGIVLLYNGANHHEHGDPTLPAFAYQPGQALFDPADPRRLHRPRPPSRSFDPSTTTSSTARSTTCASPRASSCSGTTGTSTTAWPTPGSAAPSRRGEHAFR